MAVHDPNTGHEARERARLHALRQAVIDTLKADAARLDALAEAIPFPTRPNAHAFEPLVTPMPDHVWARGALPYLRAAVMLLEFDSAGLERHWRGCEPCELHETMRGLTEKWVRVACDLDRLLRVIAEADRRARLTMARIGLDLDQPAPGAA